MYYSRMVTRAAHAVEGAGTYSSKAPWNTWLLWTAQISERSLHWASAGAHRGRCGWTLGLLTVVWYWYQGTDFLCLMTLLFFFQSWLGENGQRLCIFLVTPYISITLIMVFKPRKASRANYSIVPSLSSCTFPSALQKPSFKSRRRFILLSLRSW